MGTDPLSFIERSRLEEYDLSQDTIVNYTGTHYVRVLKLFEAPPQYSEGTTEQEQINPEHNRKFHLRYYIPKSTLISKRERVRQIVIMFNGLNEVDRFDLYDVLGEHLAEQGIAAVLLPTPYHLNRTPRPKNPATRRKPPHALLFRTPMFLYYNYKQSVSESELLIQKLRQTKQDEKDFEFYKSLFDPKLKVSILGFSLGGLRALASFILQPKQYNSCIVFNSGVKLIRLNTELINIRKKEWEKFVNRLQKDASKYSEVARPEDNLSNHSADRERALWNAFDMVFLGNHPDLLKERLKQHSKRLLLILSGADPTVPSDISELEQEGHGLNVFRIAGVGHIPTLDDKWSFWIDRVSELIVGFIGQAGQDLWSRQGIIKAIQSALPDCDYAIRLMATPRPPGAEPLERDSGKPQLEDFLDDVEPRKRAKVINSYYAAMAYYPLFSEVLEEVVKSFKRTNKTKRKATAPVRPARSATAARSAGPKH